MVHRKSDLMSYNPTTGKSTNQVEVEIDREKLGVIYCRVSSKQQVDEGNGLETQERNCLDYCKKEGIKVDKIFREEGISGTITNRKALNDCFEHMDKKNNKFTTITHFIVNEASRISRPNDLTDALELEAKINSFGVDIVKLDMIGINEDTSEGKLLKHVKYVVAGYENEQRTRRTMDGRINSLKSGGRPFPSVPLGYIKERISAKQVLITMNKSKAHILKEGIELFANDIISTQAELLRFFEEQGLKMDNDKPLQHSFVDHMFCLHRLFFLAGYILYPNWGLDEPIPGKQQGIITLNTANKVVEKLQRDKKTTNKIKIKSERMTDEHPLRGVIKCPYCERMYTSWNTSKKIGPKGNKVKKLYPYYGCNNKKCDHRMNHNKAKLEKEFENLLSSMSLNKALINLIKVVFKKAEQECEGIQKLKNKETKRRISNLEKEMRGIEESLHKITNTTLFDKRQEKWSLLEGEVIELKKSIREEIASVETHNNNFDKVIDLFEDPLGLWNMGSVRMRETLLTVRFNNNLVYKKNGGLQTNENRSLYYVLSNLSTTLSKDIGDPGFEPGTLGLRGPCSNQLS